MNNSWFFRNEHPQCCAGNDNFETRTSKEQARTEDSIEKVISRALESLLNEIDDVSVPALELHRFVHTHFITESLQNLGPSYQSMDASQTWLTYWLTHSLELLNSPPDESLSEDVARFVALCQNVDNHLDCGGFGGTCGPLQHSHLATTYGAVMTLCVLRSEAAYRVVNRNALLRWLLCLRQPDGSFRLHSDGEIDVRGCYCAVAVACVLRLPTAALFAGTAEWCARCATYEGGYSCAPGVGEAHGGYTFCAVAVLLLLGRPELIRIPQLLRWTANRQLAFEGGFSGRGNKLVDACYSYWVGALFPLLHYLLDASPSGGHQRASLAGGWLFQRTALEEYLLLCSQRLKGGFVDKPGKPVDAYHTCYALSGLSIAQHFAPLRSTPIAGAARSLPPGAEGSSASAEKRAPMEHFLAGCPHETHPLHLVGKNPVATLTEPTNPVFNICEAALREAIVYFSKLETPDAERLENLVCNR